MIDSHFTPWFSKAFLLQSRWDATKFNNSQDLRNADIKDKKQLEKSTSI